MTDWRDYEAFCSRNTCKYTIDTYYPREFLIIAFLKFVVTFAVVLQALWVSVGHCPYANARMELIKTSKRQNVKPLGLKRCTSVPNCQLPTCWADTPSVWRPRTQAHTIVIYCNVVYTFNFPTLVGEVPALCVCLHITLPTTYSYCQMARVI